MGGTEKGSGEGDPERKHQRREEEEEDEEEESFSYLARLGEERKLIVFCILLLLQ